MTSMPIVQKRYFNYMQHVTRIALENPTRETEAIAMSAIRRYHASLDGDYKTMWEENEWLLLRANTIIEETEDSLRRQTRRLTESKHEMMVIKRFHGIQ